MFSSYLVYLVFKFKLKSKVSSKYPSSELIGTVLAMSRKKRKRRKPNPQQQSFSTFVDVDAKLQQAVSLYQANQLQQAEQKCQQILRDSSQHADALHLLGVIAHQVGDYRIATSLIAQAIEIDSNQSSFFYNVGNALREQGRLEESIDAYQKAIEIQPDHADAYNNLGNVLKTRSVGEIDSYLSEGHTYSA